MAEKLDLDALERVADEERWRGNRVGGDFDQTKMNYHNSTRPSTIYALIARIRALESRASNAGGAVAWAVPAANGGVQFGPGWMFSAVKQGAATMPLFTHPQTWQPIETAPKENTPMIVVCSVFSDGYVTDPWCVWWQGGEWKRWPHDEQPTHWMPLPAAPAKPEGV